jgi:A/G-specific adenine glycosylase
MDLGATICTAGQPRCSECPVAALCASHDVIASLLRQPETGSGGSGRHRRTGPPPRQTRGSGTSRLEVDASRQARLPGPVPARPERSHRGTPLRLYRGRVIEALRNVHPRRSIPAPELGRAILPRFTERDRQVFRRILRALEKDGLIAVRRRGRSGPERVMLA